MNQEAQNCFLKILEEPKGDTVLILVTEYPEMLLPTIISRLQKIRFAPIKSSEIEIYFLNQKVPKEKIKELVSLSFGKPGRAIEFAKDSSGVESQKKIVSDLLKISKSDVASRFQYAKGVCEEKEDSAGKIKEILDIWLRYFHGIFLSVFLGNQTSSQYSVAKLKNIIKLIQSTNFLISKTNANPKLAFEILLMEI